MKGDVVGVVATLALARSANAEAKKPVACPSVSILTDATRLTQMKKVKYLSNTPSFSNSKP